MAMLQGTLDLIVLQILRPGARLQPLGTVRSSDARAGELFHWRNENATETGRRAAASWCRRRACRDSGLLPRHVLHALFVFRADFID